MVIVVVVVVVVVVVMMGDMILGVGIAEVMCSDSGSSSCSSSNDMCYDIRCGNSSSDVW